MLNFAPFISARPFADQDAHPEMIRVTTSYRNAMSKHLAPISKMFFSLRAYSHSSLKPLSGRSQPGVSEIASSLVRRLEHLFRILYLRLIPQIRREPAFSFRERHPFTLSVIGNLVFGNLTDAEIPRFRMREVKA